MTRRRGLTLIEILVVVTVIAVLGALLIPALGMAQRARHQTATTKLITNLSAAIDRYLDRHPLLPADFADKPLVHLYRGQITAPDGPMFEPPPAGLVRQVAPGTWERTSAAEAEAVCDDYAPDGGLGPLRIETAADAAGNRARYTKLIRITSVAGTPGDPADDLVYEFDLATRQWQWKR